MVRWQGSRGRFPRPEPGAVRCHNRAVPSSRQRPEPSGLVADVVTWLVLGTALVVMGYLLDLGLLVVMGGFVMVPALIVHAAAVLSARSRRRRADP